MDIESSSLLNTSEPLAAGDRIISVKSSLHGIEFNEEYADRLEEFVNIVHITTTHAYSFLKYMFLRAFDEDRNFNIRDYINEKFFSEVWLSLIDYRPGPVRAETAERRAFIAIYIQDYLRVAHYNRIPLRYSQQIALIEATKMFVAYTNNIHMTFGNHLRRAINTLLRIRERKEALIAARQEEGIPQRIILEEVRNEITLPAVRFKIAIANFSIGYDTFINMFPEDIFREALDTLRPVMEAYNENHNFMNDSVYYDSKARPHEHMLAFFRLASIFEELQIEVFNCFPLRRTYIPSYVTIDSKILCQNILGLRWTNAQDKMMYWDRVVNLDSRPFRDQENGRLTFKGTIQTDGVGVTIIKKRVDRRGRYPKRLPVDNEPIEFIHTISQNRHRELANRCVTVDPGRRDLLYFVHENSTVDNRQTFRFTKSQQNQYEKRKKYSRIKENVKTEEVRYAERLLQGSKSLNLRDFSLYLINRAQVSVTLQDHYVTTASNGHPGNPLYRKLKLSSYIRRQKGNEKLVKELREKFGNDAAYIMGNWSAPNARYHEPTRGVGFRKLLRKNNMPVFLIDEFRTSQCCPNCHNLTLETFKYAPNPRPYRRRAQPRVIRHGLLRCKNQTCRQTLGRQLGRRRGGHNLIYRYWNRDLAACLNMIHIVRSLRESLEVPQIFQRPQVAAERRRGTRRRRTANQRGQRRTRPRRN